MLVGIVFSTVEDEGETLTAADENVGVVDSISRDGVEE